MVVYVREAKGPDSLALLWHVCLAKDKFVLENLPEQIRSALLPPSCAVDSPPHSCFLFEVEQLGKGFLNTSWREPAKIFVT